MIQLEKLNHNIEGVLFVTKYQTQRRRNEVHALNIAQVRHLIRYCIQDPNQHILSLASVTKKHNMRKGSLSIS